MYQITINLLRSTFTKGKPKKTFCGCYKNFDNEKFEEELKNHLSVVQDFESFKQKVVRNNNQFFMTKILGKAIMKRSKLKNKFNKERNAKNWINCK